MVKAVLFSLIFAISFFSLIFSQAIARFINTTEIKSFTLQTKQETAKSCSYTLIIKTSCSSTSYTRDKISIAFGDSYGNEVYIQKLDDPYSGTFERCSTDTFKINGACTSDICYQYFLRRGYDGWKPESVKIYGPYKRWVTFFYNTFLPNGVWFGFNQCQGRSAIM